MEALQFSALPDWIAGLLAHYPEWQANEGDCLAPAGVLLGRLSGVAIIVVTHSPEAGFPDFARRRRSLRAARNEATILLHLDASATRRRLCWLRAGHYREEALPAEERALLRLLVAAAREACGPPPDPRRQVMLALGRLVHGPSLTRCMETSDPDQLAAAIEEIADVQALRSVWQALQRIELLDPDAGVGDWLLCAGEWLAGIYRACLTRMDGFLTDAGSAWQPRGRTLIGFERLHELSRSHGEVRYAGLLVGVKNLHGIGQDPEQTACTRVRLAHSLSERKLVDAPELLVRVLCTEQPSAAAPLTPAPAVPMPGSGSNRVPEPTESDRSRRQVEAARVRTIIEEQQLTGRLPAQCFTPAYTRLSRTFTLLVAGRPPGADANSGPEYTGFPWRIAAGGARIVRRIE